MSDSHVVVLGAGLGGTIAAYEIREALKGKARVTVVNKGEDYWFVPSNPWVAVGWREPEAIRVHLPPVMQKHVDPLSTLNLAAPADYGTVG